MKRTMKRSIVVLAAALATMSTSAMAQNAGPQGNESMVSKSVQLTDAELDGITAGAALSLVVVFNRGNKTGEAGHPEHHITMFVPTEGKTFTLHVVANRAHPEPVTRCMGHCF